MQTEREKDVSLFRLGFGCQHLPVMGVAGAEYPDEEQITAMVNLALDFGVNFFDCAMTKHRGQCERLLGKLLAPHHDDILIGTRIVLSDYTQADSICEQFAHILDNMEIDYMDYLIITVQDNMMLESSRVRRTMKEQVQTLLDSGKLHHIAFPIENRGLFARDVIGYARQYGFPADSVLAFYYPANREMEDVLVWAKQLEYRTFAIALIDYKVEMERRMSCQFVLGNPSVDVMITSNDSLEMMQEAITFYQIYGNQVLSGIERDFFSKISIERNVKKSLEDNPCTGCDFCQPCPAGIRISEWVGLCQEAVNSNFSQASERKIRAFVKQFGDPRKTCIQCGVCDQLCPQHLPVSRYMRATSLNGKLI